LYTISPSTGEVTGAATAVLLSDTRGGKKPFVAEVTSSAAEASGVGVPIPTWEKPRKQKNVQKQSSSKFFTFMDIEFNAGS
jgi:hypothetical protein